MNARELRTQTGEPLRRTWTVICLCKRRTNCDVLHQNLVGLTSEQARRYLRGGDSGSDLLIPGPKFFWLRGSSAICTSYWQARDPWRLPSIVS